MEVAPIIIHILHVRKQAQKAYALGPLASEPRWPGSDPDPTFLRNTASG